MQKKKKLVYIFSSVIILISIVLGVHLTALGNENVSGFFDDAKDTIKIYVSQLENKVTDLLGISTQSDDSSYTLSTSAQAKYVPTYVLGDSTPIMLYNPDTAKLARTMSAKAYKIGVSHDEIVNSFSDLGYGQVYILENFGGKYGDILNTTTNEKGETITESFPLSFEGVNVTVAIKKVVYNGQQKYALSVAFRGTDIWDHVDVWNDCNIIPTVNGLHSGFAGCATDFYNQSKGLKFNIDGKTVTLESIYNDMKNEDSQYCMLVTGHSLGGGIADCYVGSNLYNAGVYPGNVVAYTFAAPKSALSSYSYPYENIFNIINSEDIVPQIGLSKQIGTNIVYNPTAEFNNQYGTGIAEKHSIGKTYDAIERIIAADVNSYSNYNTTSDNIWNGSITVNQRCFGKITGNLTSSDITFNKARLEVMGDTTVGTLYMTNNDDYLLCNGNLIINSIATVYLYNGNKPNNLSAGAVEIKGNFKQSYSTYGFSSSYYYYGYWESGTHKTIFSGDKEQKIFFAQTEKNSRFANLVLNNTSEDGVVFDSIVTVSRLFNHNGNNFTLYNNGTSSTFVDFDGDGLKDNVDPFPLDPNNESNSIIDIYMVNVEPIANVLYTGEKEYYPELVVKYKGEILTQNKDYTISCINNTNPGIATVTIKGINNYIGTITYDYNIICEHNYSTEVIDPTCTTQGYTQHTCQVCNYSYTDNRIDAFGHNFVVESFGQSCDNSSHDTYTCTICNYAFDSYDGYDDYYLGHGFVCTNIDGRKIQYTCQYCDKIQIVTIDDLFEEWWPPYHINRKIYREPDDYTYLFDIVPDGIINAKDYAKMKHIYRYAK